MPFDVLAFDIDTSNCPPFNVVLMLLEVVSFIQLAIGVDDNWSHIQMHVNRPKNFNYVFHVIHEHLSPHFIFTSIIHFHSCTYGSH
jgi:hypothetical protein